MRVLVTGATGQLGRAVVLQLCNEGHAVSVLTRRPFLAADLFASGITIHEWHPLSEEVPAEAVDHADAVLHLMGAPLAGGPAHARPAEVVDSRINSTRRIVEALKTRQGVRLIVTSVAIAPAEPGPPVAESTSGATAKSSAIERHIRKWEEEAAKAGDAGASVVIVRLGLIAVPGGPLSALLGLARRGLCPNLKGAAIPAIALDDAVAMLTGLLEQRSPDGVIHGVAPEPLAGEALMRALRRHAPAGRAMTVPISLLRRRLGLTAALLSCHRQILPQRLVDAGAAYVAPDPTEAIARALDDVADGWPGVSQQRRFRAGAHEAPPEAEPEAT